MSSSNDVYGALAGWKFTPSANGFVITMQIAESVESWKNHDYANVKIALNDRQIRSLARDLDRKVKSRGLVLRPRAAWWKRMFRL